MSKEVIKVSAEKKRIIKEAVNLSMSIMGLEESDLIDIEIGASQTDIILWERREDGKPHKVYRRYYLYHEEYWEPKFRVSESGGRSLEPEKAFSEIREYLGMAHDRTGIEERLQDPYSRVSIESLRVEDKIGLLEKVMQGLEIEGQFKESYRELEDLVYKIEEEAKEEGLDI